MSKILVQTGLGYFKDDQDRVVCKADLPAGEHPVKPGYTYHEVNSQAELDVIAVFQDPEKRQAAANEQAIQLKLRDFAIAELTKDGQWPAQL